MSLKSLHYSIKSDPTARRHLFCSGQVCLPASGHSADIILPMLFCPGRQVVLNFCMQQLPSVAAAWDKQDRTQGRVLRSTHHPAAALRGCDRMVQSFAMAQRHPIQNDQTMLIATITKDRKPAFRIPAYAREAIECLYRTQDVHPFFLFGFVMMPDHCHLLVHVPAPEKISHIMNAYKAGLIFDLGIPKLWQPRFHIRCIDDTSSALRYIHLNPVRKGLAETPEDYPWSSACGKWDISPLDIV